MKRYLVTIQARYSNGRYGKDRYIDMEIAGGSKKAASEIGMQKVREMTYAEFERRCDDRSHARPWGWYGWCGPCSMNEPIGEIADKYFSCKAEIMEGDI